MTIVALVAFFKKIPAWVWELVGLAIIIFAIWFVLHERYEAGIKAQIAADNAQTQKLVDAAAAETAQLKLKAQIAETAYDDELEELRKYHADDSNLTPVRLCINEGQGGSSVPHAAPKKPRVVDASATAADVQHLSDANSSGGDPIAGPDIRSMLALLATKADELAAQLREEQKR